MTAALEIESVSLNFRGMPVLEDVDLTLEPGAFLGLIGPNGGGKSVLLKVILGLLSPDRGSVRVFGRRPADARGLVSYVPQYGRFDPSFPICVRDVVLAARLGGGWRKRRYSPGDHEWADTAMQQMNVTELARRQIGKLSGGQLQRVLIARALAANASLLLLDEPTASLDSRAAAHLYDLLAELSPTKTIVLVSHDVGVMHRHVKTVACLNRRMHYHNSKEITQEMIEEAYGCPVDILVHRHTHRVLGRPGDTG